MRRDVVAFRRAFMTRNMLLYSGICSFFFDVYCVCLL